MDNTKVVITGLGVVSSIGIGIDNFWPNLIAGKSGISEVESVDTSKYDRHFGGEVKGFKPAQFVKRSSLAATGRASQLAIAAARLALEDAKMLANNNGDLGVILGTTMADAPVIEIMNKIWVEEGDKQVGSYLVMQYSGNVLSANVAVELELKGLNAVLPTACAAGNYAIGYAFDLIRQGKAKKMLAGGTDAFSRIAFTGFGRLFAMAREICRPFDKNRDGMILGEGAGVLVLERLEDALKRKAPIYAEVLGYGLSCDGHHMTQPSVEGIKKCMLKAMKEANIQPQEVDYISAHGTGTPQNDRTECQAIKEVFLPSSSLRGSGATEAISKKGLLRPDSVGARNDGRRTVPAVSSIKSMLGHTMGAAAAIEAIACCLAIKDSLIPPTTNYETPDLECDIDCVPNEARKKRLNVVLNNSYAFGGNNACLVLRRFKSKS